MPTAPNPMSVIMKHQATLRNCAILLLLCLLCYVFFLDGPFISDDLSIIAGNPNIRNLSDVGQFFTARYWNEVHTGTKGVFRPLRETSFSLIYAVLGPTPLAYHVVSFVMHVAVTLLLYFLARKLLEDDLAAVLGAATFAAHPVHLEAVLWAKNLAELLAALFVILAFTAFLRALRENKRSRTIAWCTGAAALYGLGLLCKESALALPGILLLYALFSVPRDRARKAALIVAPMMLIGLAYVAFQFTSSRLIAGAAHTASTLPEDTLLLRPALVAKTYATYVGLLLFPVQLSTQYDFLFPSSYFTADTILYLAAFAVLSAAIVVGLIWWRRRAYLVLWTVAFLVPAANIIPFKGRPLGDQRLYVASMGACLLFGLIGAKSWRRCRPYMERRFATALLIGIPLIAMMALSLDRGQIWHDQNLYWCDLLRKSPAQAGAQYAVGQLDLAQGRDRAALDRASYAIALGEEMLARTGGTSVEPGGQDEALKAQVAQSYVLRARSYGLLGEHAQAAEDCQAAIRLAPNLPSAHASLGLAYLSQNKFAPAAAEFLAATKLAPGNPAYFTCLAQADISLGEYEAAAQALRQALTIDPEYEPALQLLPQGVPRPPPSN